MRMGSVNCKPASPLIGYPHSGHPSIWEAKQWCLRMDCGQVKLLRAAEAVMSRTWVAELSGGGLGTVGVTLHMDSGTAEESRARRSSGHFFVRATALVRSVSSGWETDMCTVTYSGGVRTASRRRGKGFHSREQRGQRLRGTSCWELSLAWVSGEPKVCRACG